MTSERTEVALGVLLITHVRGADRNGPGCALPRRRRPATCRGSEAQAEMHVVRRRTEELPIKRGCFASALAREHDGGGRHVRSDQVQPEIECRRDHEVRTGATKTPEQVRVFFIADVAHRAVRGPEFSREQVVDREAVLWLEAAHATSEREPRDPGVTDDADRTRESVLLRSAVEVLEQRASLHSRDPLTGSISTARMPERPMTTPPSHVEKPATLWPPPRTAMTKPCSRNMKPTVVMSWPSPRATA